MKIGISTASFFSRFRTEESLRYIGLHGVDTAEVFLDSYSEYTQTFAHTLLDISKSTNTKIVSVHAMAQQFEPQLFSIGERQRKDAWELFQQVLSLARTLDAHVYVFHGPAMLLGALKNAQLERIGPIVSELADLAMSYGVRLCWENVSWAMFRYPEFAHDILKYCPSKNLGFTLDIKQAERAGGDPFDFLYAMGDRLCHVHLCDVMKNTNPEGPLLQAMPGQGEFDFARLGKTLKQIGYEGYGMIEVYSDLYQDNEEVLHCRDEMEALLS